MDFIWWCYFVVVMVATSGVSILRLGAALLRAKYTEEKH